MTTSRSRLGLFRSTALAGACAVTLVATAAVAQERAFDIPAQPLSASLRDYGLAAGEQIIFAENIVRGRRAPALQGSYTSSQALDVLLADTGLMAQRTASGGIMIAQRGEGGSGPQSAGAGDVEALIVTAQKREENIQDVPIAISAFSQEDLERSQIAGGPDLYTQVPNFSFTKTNFSSYSIQIRGIGTQAISATTDPAVAVAFNNTPFIHNRFFEQEFFDLERVEVLRGPQGTLYGRNATAGVVNIISAKPRFYTEAKLSADAGNYNSTRIEGMVNIPLVEDTVALRLAGAWTKRDGYAHNQVTGEQIDGRDLWSTRLSLRFAPTDNIEANLVWEHFEEDDDRIRSGKQLCKKHVPTEVGGIAANPTGYEQSYISQGCERVSLYSEEAFQTPNGYSLPYVLPLTAIALPLASTNFDVYASEVQSLDLRVIESTVEPEYWAMTDIAQLQISIDLTDTLTLSSETAYGADRQYSLQDYNRFTSIEGIFKANGGYGTFSGLSAPPYPYTTTPDGFFCDPQLGCSNNLLLVDLSTSDSRQFNQEFRLSSDYDSPFNFSLGANYTRLDAETKYYVFINTLSLWAAAAPDLYDPFFDTHHVPSELRPIANPLGMPSFTDDPDALRVYDLGYIYTDPNPIGALNDMGRNYFLSKNPYKLISYALFGEAYYEVTDNLKITGGLRFTVDKKTAPQIPSWLLAGGGPGGPYPTLQTIDQEWREPTGRLAIDWKPDLAFTDETLVYASYAHGYKAGGANPPPPVFVTYGGIGGPELLPDTFEAEFVDAFEIGTKNTLFDGGVTLNLTGFYYDYRGYQVSEIRNRSAINSNYDAQVWGVEIEADWRPLENLKFAFKGGYNGTRIADGESSIDLMDRSAGDPDYVVYRPFPSVPSNCIIPIELATEGGDIQTGGAYSGMCLDLYYGVIYEDPEYDPYVPPGGFDPNTVPNQGRGVSKQLGGNELPNAPDFTATLSTDYTLPLANEWLLTFHGDAHWQSDSWWRVFNDHEYNRLDEFYTINLAAILENDDAGWRVMAYVKNVLDNDALTGAFLNSDDSGLTTNVFLVEPRLYGLRVTKNWSDAPFFGGLIGGRRDGPYRFWVEFGGGVSRLDGDAEIYNPWAPEVLAASPAVQDEDLDWGDVRNVKLTYVQDSWRVSAAHRWGRTNGAFRGAAYEDIPGWISNAGQYVQRDNHAITDVRDAEEYSVTEFMVDKEVGLGAWGDGAKSVLSAGLRYATFESTSHVGMGGVADAFNDPIIGKYDGVQHWNLFETYLDSTRKFEGAGPALSWESSLRLAGAENGGHVDLDWQVGGAVLFGKQATETLEDRFGRYYNRVGNGGVFGGSATRITLYDDITPIRRFRSEDVTVPNLSLELGLSYTIDRVKVSTGYSWDRFFDAIDGGFDEAKSYDRTIQGPYLKLSFGFGG